MTDEALDCSEATDAVGPVAPTGAERDHQERVNSPQPTRPGMYLVVTNISKKPNVRSLLLTAAAFGCRAVLVVGQPSFDMDADIPRQLRRHLREGRMPIQRFEKWKDCVLHLQENGIRLVGVEIHKDAQSIESFFDASVPIAFLMGNEGQGLSAKQMECCDGFVRIPQYGGGTASLNVYVAASIVLHRYHQFLLQQEASAT